MLLPLYLLSDIRRFLGKEPSCRPPQFSLPTAPSSLAWFVAFGPPLVYALPAKGKVALMVFGAQPIDLGLPAAPARELENLSHQAVTAFCCSRYTRCDSRLLHVFEQNRWVRTRGVNSFRQSGDAHFLLALDFMRVTISAYCNPVKINRKHLQLKGSYGVLHSGQQADTVTLEETCAILTILGVWPVFIVSVARWNSPRGGFCQ